MGYLFLLLAGFLAGLGFYELQRKSFWEHTEAGCFNGCLLMFGEGVAVVVLGFVVFQHMNYWRHVFAWCGGFCGTLLLMFILGHLAGLWSDDDSS